MYSNLKELLPIFGYSGEALNSFKNRIDNQDISIVYKKIIKEDNRLIKKISIEERECFDEGWIVFKSSFGSFCRNYDISYQNFFDNKFIIGKQEKKLFKACKEFYVNREIAIKSTDEDLEMVSALSLPKKELYIVLSVNLNDFLLCSTKNDSWTSCLDIASGDYWSSLSGTLLDKNRAMIYMTDLKEKEFEGIKSYNMFNRSWCLLDSENRINVNISYPTKREINALTYSNALGFPVKNLNTDFVSRYEIIPIYNDNKVFPFCYQDNSTFCFDEKKLKIKGSEYGGAYDIIHDFNEKPCIEKHEKIYDLPDYYTLKDDKSTLVSYLLLECDECGSLETSLIYVNDKILCKECFNKSKLTCCSCGKTYKKKFITVDNQILCEKCKNDLTKCKNCGKYFEGYGEELCSDCSSKSKVRLCDRCNKYFDKTELNDLTRIVFKSIKGKYIPFDKNGKICDNCLEAFTNDKHIVYCDNCGNYYEENENKTCSICGNY